MNDLNILERVSLKKKFVHRQHNKETKHKQTSMEMLGYILKYFKSINFQYPKLRKYRQNWEHKSTITQQYLQECHINLHSTKNAKSHLNFTQKIQFLFNILFQQLKLIFPFGVKTIKGV
jgi:hypothetical protein